MIEIVTASDLEVPRSAVAWKPPHILLIGTDADTSQRNNDHDRPRQSRIRIACDALDYLRVALAEAEVRVIGGSVLIIHEGNWVRAETAAWTPEGVSVLNGKPTASDEFGLGWKAEVPLYEEDGDEDKITVELDEHGPLDSVVTASLVVERFEENNEDKAEEDDSPLFALSLIDFAHTRLAPG
ncbi:hypothetical protein BKA82DRAFT_31058 [Pisolithus tinctorius]|uniref:Uncharacterized protein n=1 Tax=Pisolithus tinctorius Marx 270 TaxID=870435 RepID=A0A0C3IP36_PISTI|nr:hypothetical protein BKA82DRAFT_31058 [Pisolithus tinctorius]KIN98732.1 hypothetical protein M404DRAFT_31058 [Pisolithus tinctorius Marx 270]